MRADTFNLTKIFGQDARYVVPLFQRPYVWNQDKNWEPLWEDVQRAASEVEEGTTGHPHFLGAIVLASVEPEFGQLGTWEVIDGQQRLTTLQVLLAASRSAVESVGDERSARLLGKFIDNDPDLVPPSAGPARWKVWPTNADQSQFTQAMTTGNGDGQLVKARRWFEHEVVTWLREAPDLEHRIAALVSALREKLRLVVIDLEKEDDAQVIFETLNGRGTPLEAADLVKNLLFRVAKQRGDDVERLYAELWLPFDQDAWRKQVSVGRQYRSRLDVFLTHWLSMRTRHEVTTSTMYAGMSDWIEASKPAPEEVFKELSRYAAIYESFESYPSESFEGRFFDRLNAHQTTTVIPLLLYVWGLGSDLDPEQRARIVRALDSFLMRRAVCGGSTKDYNNLFRDLLVAAAEAEPADIDVVVVERLADAGAETRVWPSDAAFQRALVQDRLYKTMVRARLRSLLEGIEHELRRTGFTEQLAGSSGLTIEHVMPQGWKTHWPLGDDLMADERDQAVQTLGNLTLVTQKLNPTMSNSPWHDKRSWLATHSLLRLTTASILQAPPSVQSDDEWAASWNEDRVLIRGQYLAGLAIKIWPSPDDLLGRPLNRPASADAVIAVAPPIQGRVDPGRRAGTRQQFSDTLAAMVADGVIQVGAVLTHAATSQSEAATATVMADGKVRCNGTDYGSVSAAAEAVTGYATRGWTYWSVMVDDNLVPLQSLRRIDTVDPSTRPGRSADGPGKGIPTDQALATADIEMTCRVCGETKPGRKFPTFSVMRPGEFPRDDECRDCQKRRRGLS